MSTFLYFAYGSNKLAERLRLRCPSARSRGAVCLLGNYDLVFSKRSVDGSGKAALIEISNGLALAHVYGVLYELDHVDRRHLDHVEGDGYTPVEGARVQEIDGADLHSALTYVAQPEAIAAETDMKPYDWYMALIVAGARQHDLPQDYIAALDTVPVQTDPVHNRQRRQEALRVLKAAGFPFPAP